MFPVSAQQKTPDLDPETHADNAPHIEPGSGPTQETDGSALAARILQLHSANADPGGLPPKRPKATWLEEEDEPPLDIPRVLTKPDPASSAHLDQPAPSAPTVHAPPSPPGFRYLALSTLVIGFVGGGALAVEFDVLKLESGATDLTVNTETINVPASPLLEKPSGAQIASAKERIRDAFAAGTSAASDLTPEPETAAQSPAPRREPVSGPATPDPHLRAAVRLASTAATLPVSSGIRPAPAGNGPAGIGHAHAPATPQTDHSASPRDIPGRSDQLRPDTVPLSVQEPPQDLATGVSVDPAYPNSGRTTVSVNLRESEDKNADIVAVIPENTGIRFKDCGRWWCGVSFNGAQGFVGKDFMEPVKVATAIVTGENAGIIASADAQDPKAEDPIVNEQPNDPTGLEPDDWETPAELPIDLTHMNIGIAREATEFRGSPDTSLPVMAIIPEGAAVRYNTCSDGWCEAGYQDRRGYVREDAIERQQNETKSYGNTPYYTYPD
ncbi:hypothetical protein E1180_07445 [Roseibium denhamense]|uniref:SH3 domain-containing protein n=1 Tax=Roseibium denhamense TaxID=76305 RepID=A0ABY1NU13_9HYPH|nr:hypothetical protein [Roseibium denhamense]MTI05347.1 hypothetical protein [Roseibium denhamense]SMP17250.1 hypothetical protein SAMN06265374_1800 [Roseibium denhamense]